VPLGSIDQSSTQLDKMSDSVSLVSGEPEDPKKKRLEDLKKKALLMARKKQKRAQQTGKDEISETTSQLSSSQYS